MCNREKWTVIPVQEFKIKRNCPKCGEKKSYISTENFRVNANGNTVDVWLIYQCEKCRSTCNLTIYERTRPQKIPVEEYQGFLDNSRTLAGKYGADKTFFQKNRAEILKEDIRYEVRTEKLEERSQECRKIFIENPWLLKIKITKLLAEVMGLSVSALRRMVKEGKIWEREGANIAKPSARKKYLIIIKETPDDVYYPGQKEY